jgi:hypothetical protein
LQFHLFSVELCAAIFRAKVRRAIEGLVSRASQKSWKGPAPVLAFVAAPFEMASGGASA